MIETMLRDDFFDIGHDDDLGCLHVNWKGYQTDASVKTGVNQLIDLMTTLGVNKILNDNSNVLGIWTAVAGWLVFDALPRARKAGMTSFAHVFGPSRFSRISAEAALMLLSPVVSDIKAFDDIDDAKDWLRNRP